MHGEFDGPPASLVVVVEGEEKLARVDERFRQGVLELLTRGGSGQGGREDRRERALLLGRGLSHSLSVELLLLLLIARPRAERRGDGVVDGSGSCSLVVILERPRRVYASRRAGYSGSKGSKGVS